MCGGHLLSTVEDLKTGQNAVVITCSDHDKESENSEKVSSRLTGIVFVNSLRSM